MQPSSNGSWFCPMMCLILTPSFFLGSTGQGVQQGSTGCSQMNPKCPFCDRDLQPASGKRCTSQVSTWNQVTNLALSASYGNEAWKDKKRHKFRSWLIGVSLVLRSWRVHWSISESGWDDSEAKTGTKRVPTVVALATLREVFHDLEV